MADITPIGARVQVHSADMKDNLGLGTYLGDLELMLKKGGLLQTSWIFLDSGKGIFGLECWWEEIADAAPIHPIEITLQFDVRTFTNIKANRLARTEETIIAGKNILLEEVRVMYYDHRDQVAARFTEGNDALWIIITEMEPVPYYAEGAKIPISVSQH